ncbi:MAG: hypothetical protein ACREVS_13840 [Burkholderiales bacterium]
MIAEPEARPAPPPFRVRLGDVVHLNGALPRDLPPADAEPRPCCGCAGIVFRQGYRYCDECRQKLCRTCHGRDGQHRPGCASTTASRPCRGCGVAFRAAGGWKYCTRCRAQKCPECLISGGRHAERCRYDQRRHRGAPRPPGVYRGIVTREDIIRCFVEMRAAAVRVARGIVGNLWAEDIAQETFVYLLDRRDELTQVPTLGYVLKATQHAAFAWKRRVVHLMSVPVDPAYLIDLEAMMYALEHGRARTPEVTFAEPVRLPEPVGLRVRRA